MKNIYNLNGVPFWNSKEILMRQQLSTTFAQDIQEALLDTNKAWCFHQIEAPSLIPKDLISKEYTTEDVFHLLPKPDERELVLRPETTPASYAYAEHLLHNQLTLPPLVVWQTAKSFRKEQDQVSKNMRLKEFYQQEFQCIFTADTKNDYFEAIAPIIEQMIHLHVGLETRLIPSDRLPDYSVKTMDVEVLNDDKWMEVVSLSLRKDVPFQARFKSVEKDLINFEIAIGLDRCVYNKLRLFKD
jgi:glycyl-tRNA synthetase